MKRVILISLLVAASAPFLVISGCKQGDGERCQVNEDCEGGTCNKAKGTCSSGGDDTDFDAGVVDAPPADAPPVD